MDDDGAFWRITSGLEGDPDRAASRVRDELAGARAAFTDRLRQVPAGEVVVFVTVDGSTIRGRVLDVGTDVARVGEVVDGTGVEGRRVVRQHDIRIDAVVRLTWETAP